MELKQALGVLSITCCLAPNLYAGQTQFPQAPQSFDNSVITFEGATIHFANGQTINNGKMAIQSGKILAIGDDLDSIKGSTVINLKGMHVYPGFIDPLTSYGLNFKYDFKKSEQPVYQIDRQGGIASNQAIHAEQAWVEHFNADPKAAKTFINNGFTSVATVVNDGIFQGQAAVVSLADRATPDVIYKATANHYLSFDKGASTMEYPTSTMGAMALIRQTFSDADWYQQNANKQGANYSQGKVEFNAALAALANNEQAIIFSTHTPNDLLRASLLVNQAKRSGIYVASGREYQKIDQIKDQIEGLILPLTLPNAPKISSITEAYDVSLSALRHWERAPTNAATLESAKVPFSFTNKGIKPEKFLPRVREFVNAGLSQQQALKALTQIPAKQLGIDNISGDLKPGYYADFIIADGNLFEEGEIISVYTQGQANPVKDNHFSKYLGQYQLTVENVELLLELAEQKGKLQVQLQLGEQQLDVSQANMTLSNLDLVANLAPAGFNQGKLVSLNFANDTISGQLHLAAGNYQPISGIKLEPQSSPQDKKTTSKPAAMVSKLTSPFSSFGLQQQPKQQNIHIKNVTVWTSAKAGKLNNYDVIIEDGEIIEIGKNLDTPSDFTVIDGSNKHLTAGIIDEHSHIAINGGVNEASDAITAEVTIEDVVNPDDIHIYRSLAGGVTTAQLLHGSANPIGGRSALIQLKWGQSAQDMLLTQAPAIKFALGENVKQSNWGDKYRSRFPQTRMGVTAMFDYAFSSAKDYQQRLADYEDLSRSEKRMFAAPRPDHRLDNMVQVLQNKRDIHIHSYVQSEILAFIDIAEKYDIKIGTFTHILEGYKAAPEIAAHGAGASTFSDWWAYKYEVIDAVPHNACLMHEQGVLTSINSDDNEMQRRLNQEAAKSIMYCGMSEIDALNMITINPAKQLKIDGFTGSIEVGKQADIVLWDTHPLSVYAQVESTWIDGRKYYDRQQNSQQQIQDNMEKQALLEKLLSSDFTQNDGELTPEPEPAETWHCDTVTAHHHGEH
ncbi:amidohydrolase family protein [Paraferrimonas sp. SM1919]|uniref:amidohydrolase family protein n=1 Tax=Paraferrimonas sp. SM1919 TaxID=2662263 RepID=UPI0013D8610A|nr:amidohydrolase family protein [Paraferrimonas sp. SM1919]